MTFDAALDDLLAQLQTGAPPTAFNQFAQVDPVLDHPDGAARRRDNLARYLRTFRSARWLLCAEAAGYNGARFSGVTLCDEAKLVGPDALAWAGVEAGYRRGSTEAGPLHREISSTIVWRALGNHTDVVLWNAVPWHPSGPDGPLSNRSPSPAELAAGLVVLRHVLTHLLPDARPIAVGRVAATLLADLGHPTVPRLRHPAHGGARLFTDGLKQVMSDEQ